MLIKRIGHDGNIEYESYRFSKPIDPKKLIESCKLATEDVSTSVLAKVFSQPCPNNEFESAISRLLECFERFNNLSPFILEAFSSVRTKLNNLKNTYELGFTPEAPLIDELTQESERALEFINKFPQIGHTNIFVIGGDCNEVPSNGISFDRSINYEHITEKQIKILEQTLKKIETIDPEFFELLIEFTNIVCLLKNCPGSARANTLGLTEIDTFPFWRCSTYSIDSIAEGWSHETGHHIFGFFREVNDIIENETGEHEMPKTRYIDLGRTTPSPFDYLDELHANIVGEELELKLANYNQGEQKVKRIHSALERILEIEPELLTPLRTIQEQGVLTSLGNRLVRQLDRDYGQIRRNLDLLITN